MAQTTSTETTDRAPSMDDASDSTLRDEMASAFGDYATAFEESDAGTAKDSAPETSDDAPAAERAGTTPADAAAEAEPATLATDREPAAEATAEATPADPFANAQPLTYTVDGQERSFDGVKVLRAADGTPEGAIVVPDQLEKLQLRLSRADYYEAQNRTLYGQVQEYERLGGADKLATLTAENAKLTAAVQLLAPILEDPSRLAAILQDPREVPMLARELALLARDAEAKARQQFGESRREHQQQSTQETTLAGQRTAAITQTIDTYASQFPALTPDDRKTAEAHFAKVGSAVVRPATAEEARTTPGIKPGQVIIDQGLIYEWLQDRAALRAQAADTQKKQAESATKAAQENAARLRGAQRAPTPSAKPTGAKGPKPATSAPAKHVPTWQEMQRAMQAGRFLPDVVGDDDGNE